MQWLALILLLPYLLFIIPIYKGLLKLKKYQPGKIPSVSVSLVIACHNEEINLPSLLSAIKSQDYPAHLLETIIVDDHSTDNTAQIITASAPGSFRYLKNQGKGKKQALRSGILDAKGELILTTDADCVPGNVWIKTIAGYYEQFKPDIISAPVITTGGKGFFGRFQEIEFLSLQGITSGATSIGKPVMCNGANLAFKKEVYERHAHNLHDEINSGDDIFLLHSIKKEPGSTISWIESEDAMIITRQASSFSSYLNQRNRWISKSSYYNDYDTIVLGLATFAAIAVQTISFIGAIIYPGIFGLFLTALVVKSIPDYLVIKNTAKRYNKSKVMRWFLPAQLIYPFYVLGVLIYPLGKRISERLSSPSRKGI